MTGAFRGGPKPRDVGTGVICASFGRGGEWLSLGAVHPRHGFVELSALPPFDAAWRGRPARVRRYRALMADEAHAFLTTTWPAPVEQTYLALPGAHQIGQRCTFRAAPGEAPPATIRLRVRGRLDRPALAEITELEPPAPTGAQTVLAAAGLELHLSAPLLPARATVRVEGEGLTAGAGWRVDGDAAELRVPWPADGVEVRLLITCSLDWAPAAEAGHQPRVSFTPPKWLVVPADLRAAVERIGQRALRYVIECTALRVAPGRRVILADHRSLPLSWTRDAYYQGLLLLGASRADLVADHLRWLWLSCARPNAAWARSHHANGQRKDERYQVDQQLYPLLELCDYWRVTGGLPVLDDIRLDWTALVSAVLEQLESEQSGEGLLPSQENAADDRAALPYLLSSQILAWYTLSRLAELNEILRLDHPVAAMAERLRLAVYEHFPADGPAGRLWAYAVDGTGQSQLLQDANDLPTALAPLWGFCSADDPLWRATIDFAFSAANPAHADGPAGGLGSPHTAGVWSLGLIQEWVARSLTGETRLAADALRRFVATACSDGALPEASDPASAALAARPWFAWPGAVVGALMAPIHS